MKTNENVKGNEGKLLLLLNLWHILEVPIIFGKYSSEVFSPPYFLGSSTPYSNRLHFFFCHVIFLSMALGLELEGTSCLWALYNHISVFFTFVFFFLCNSMPWSSCSASYGTNPIKKKDMWLNNCYRIRHTYLPPSQFIPFKILIGAGKNSVCGYYLEEYRLATYSCQMWLPYSIVGVGNLLSCVGWSAVNF